MPYEETTINDTVWWRMSPDDDWQLIEEEEEIEPDDGEACTCERSFGLALAGAGKTTCVNCGKPLVA